MPETKKNPERAERGEKAPTTQAGEMIREEMHELKKGGGTARTRKQAVAIGLSRARRAGIPVPVPRKGKVSEATRRKAAQDLRKGKEASGDKRPSRRSPPKAEGAKEGSERKTPARKAPAPKGGAVRRARAGRTAGRRGERAAPTKRAAAPRKRKQDDGAS